MIDSQRIQNRESSHQSLVPLQQELIELCYSSLITLEMPKEFENLWNWIDSQNSCQIQIYVQQESPHPSTISFQMKPTRLHFSSFIIMKKPKILKNKFKILRFTEYSQIHNYSRCSNSISINNPTSKRSNRAWAL